MKEIIQVPDGFSVELGSYKLVRNISPFPVISAHGVTQEPYDVEDRLVWVQLKPKLYGLFERKFLNPHRCPTCGQAWNPEGE